MGLEELLEYTDWDRVQWESLLTEEGNTILSTDLGPGTGGRMNTIGELIRHIFSAEARYVDRLLGRQPSDTSTIGTGDVKVLFDFGRTSRAGLADFLDGQSGTTLGESVEFEVLNTYRIEASVEKVICHVLLHEIRHWAQVATLLRFRGISCGFRDFLVSPVMGGSFRRIDDPYS